MREAQLAGASVVCAVLRLSDLVSCTAATVGLALRRTSRVAVEVRRPLLIEEVWMEGRNVSGVNSEMHGDDSVVDGGACNSQYTSWPPSCDQVVQCEVVTRRQVRMM